MHYTTIAFLVSISIVFAHESDSKQHTGGHAKASEASEASKESKESKASKSSESLRVLEAEFEHAAVALHNTSQRRSLVVGGAEASPQSFPSTALVGIYSPELNKYAVFCGGNIVSPMHVMTAAHCVYEDLGFPYIIFAGVHDLRDISLDTSRPVFGNLPIQFSAVARRHIHPGYNHYGVWRMYEIDGQMRTLIEFDDDGAILDLVAPIDWPTFQRFADVDTAPTDLQLVGWGHDGSGSLSDVMKEATLPYVPPQECLTRYLQSGSQTYVGGPTHICAGGVAGTTPCNGDSGGPLMKSRSADDGSGRLEWDLVGLVSFGLSGQPLCEQRFNEPAVFARVVGMITWACRLVPDAPACQHHFQTHPEDAASPGDVRPLPPPAEPGGTLQITSNMTASPDPMTRPAIAVQNTPVLWRSHTGRRLISALQPRFVRAAPEQLYNYMSGSSGVVEINLFGRDAQLKFLDLRDESPDETPITISADCSAQRIYSARVEPNADGSNRTVYDERTQWVNRLRIDAPMYVPSRVSYASPSTWRETHSVSMVSCEWSNSNLNVSFDDIKFRGPIASSYTIARGSLPDQFSNRAIPYTPRINASSVFDFESSNRRLQEAYASGVLSDEARDRLRQQLQSAYSQGSPSPPNPDSTTDGSPVTLPNIPGDVNDIFAGSDAPSNPLANASQQEYQRLFDEAVSGRASPSDFQAYAASGSDNGTPFETRPGDASNTSAGQINLGATAGGWAVISMGAFNPREPVCNNQTLWPSALMWHVGIGNVVDDFLIVNAELDVSEVQSVDQYCAYPTQYLHEPS